MIQRLLLLAVAALALTTAAHAQLMGNTLTAEWRYPDIGSAIESHLVTVSAGVELPSATIVNDSKFDIDIGDDWVEFRFNATSNWSNTTFNGWHFHDTYGAVSAITGYAVDSYSAGVTGVANVVPGYSADDFWADFGGLAIAGNGDWIRMKVTFSGPNLAVTNLVAGQTATITVTGATANGLVGVGYSLAGAGPTTINAGSCGSLTVSLSLPIKVLGTYSAVGTTMTTSSGVPAGASGVPVWMQALDFGSCTLSNSLALTVL
ncbi:MAG: hypothetical protein H8E31_09685 [Planctomycetes bacterium]|nr:hypothetical protein [Planctomycetota bacterium]